MTCRCLIMIMMVRSGLYVCLVHVAIPAKKKMITSRRPFATCRWAHHKDTVSHIQCSAENNAHTSISVFFPLKYKVNETYLPCHVILLLLVILRVKNCAKGLLPDLGLEFQWHPAYAFNIAPACVLFGNTAYWLKGVQQRICIICNKMHVFCCQVVYQVRIHQSNWNPYHYCASVVMGCELAIFLKYYI